MHLLTPAPAPHDGSRAQAPRRSPQSLPPPESGPEGDIPGAAGARRLRLGRLFSGLAEGSAGTPAGAQWPARDREDGTRLEAGGGRSRRSRGQGEGGSDGRLGASDAAPAAGPVSTALPVRVAGGASRSRSAGGGPGSGRARVASAAAPVYYCDSSYFLFGGLGERKKKNPGWGQGYRGCGEPESGGLEGTRVGSGRHLLPSSPRGCLAREPAEKCSLLQRYFGVLGRTEGGSHTPPSVGVEAAAAGTGWSLQPARPLPCLFPSLQNCC